MAYTEILETFIEVTPTGHLQIKEVTITFKDGVEIGRSNFRRVIHPGDNVANESDEIKRHAEIAWTDERVAAEQARKAEALGAVQEDD